MLDTRYVSDSEKPHVADPLSWWKEHCIGFPRLATLAKRFLCVACSSSHPCVAMPEYSGYMGEHSHNPCDWGDGDMKRIYSLAVQVDKLQSLWSASGVKHRRRYRLKAKAALFRSRIRSVVDETHKKLCTYLCSNYSVVLMPEFTTSKMVSRKHRKIGSHTARSMYTWAHYRFRQRLLHKVREYPSCKVVLCDEAYTSMTCGACGTLHHSLGASKQFRCPSCGCTLDRDANGARNILLRYLSLCGVGIAHSA